MKHVSLSNRYITDLPASAYRLAEAQPAPAPQMLLANTALAEALGIDSSLLTDAFAAARWSGNQLPANSTPIALAYAGHQFGTAVPALGDGRALLLGQIQNQQGQWRDLQLKGSGPTPFSRRGDGRAALGPVLREYLVSEAMYALGIPTTRALAAVTTGESIARNFGPEPGAVLTRVAASHLRFGSFEYFAHQGDQAAIQALADVAIAWHDADLTALPATERYLRWFERIVARTAALVSEWLRVGFIHGVMNTDNMTLSGETLDYGPCAFMDAFNPSQSYSAVDRNGRYAYNRQPAMARWNLTRLAECLIDLLGPDEHQGIDQAERILAQFEPTFEAAYSAMLGRKLGLSDGQALDRAEDADLGERFLELLARHQLDFTQSFQMLGAHSMQSTEATEAIIAMFQHDPEAIDWLSTYRQVLAVNGTHQRERQARMQTANPVFIPRNHRVEQAIDAALEGDLGPTQRLLTVLQSPYQQHAQAADLALAPFPEQIIRATYCGT